MEEEIIQSIAQLSIGVTFRSRLEASPLNGVPVIQMKDLGDTSVHLKTITKFDLTPPRSTSFLEPRDILFRSRGKTTTAVIVPKDIGKKVVLAAPLFLIRIKDKSVILPEYLCWYINQKTTQRLLSQMAEGSALKMINIKYMGHLKVPLPSLKIQYKMSKIASMLTKEMDLIEKIKQKRKEYVGAILRKQFQKNHKKYSFQAFR